MTTTTHLHLTLIEQNQSQKEVTVNEALVALDAILNTGAKDKDLATPPVSPATGDVYIIATSATGAWLGKDQQVTYYNQGWQFIAPNEGMLLWVNDEDALYAYNGMDWVAAGGANSSIMDRLGINASADAVNRLVVASEAVLFNHNGSHCQVKINKHAASDTASFLYQTNFSGRAEFGTVGSDHFQLKVSPDGNNFYQSFVVDNATGAVAFKQNVNHEDHVLQRPELKDYAETRTSANSGAAYTINLENGNIFEITLTGNCVFTFTNPPVAGKAGSFTLILRQDGAGGRVATWPGAVDWPGGIVPTFTMAAGAVDILTFVTTDGGVTWWGFLSGADMK